MPRRAPWCRSLVTTDPAILCMSDDTCLMIPSFVIIIITSARNNNLYDPHNFKNYYNIYIRSYNIIMGLIIIIAWRMLAGVLI